MSDVQRELFNLREKATAIANDTTREEKIKKLDTDQKWFRNEAMRLDIETNEFRKKMRSIKVTIQSTGQPLTSLHHLSLSIPTDSQTVERERDWLLEKLRAAKEKYQKLKHGSPPPLRAPAPHLSTLQCDRISSRSMAMVPWTEASLWSVAIAPTHWSSCEHGMVHCHNPQLSSEIPLAIGESSCSGTIL